MKTNYHPFARKLRQFKHQAKTIKRLHTDGSFSLLSDGRQQQLVGRLKKLYLQLRGRLHQWKLNKAMAGLSFLFLGLGNMPAAQAQIYGPAQTNPFNIQTQGDLNFLAFADLDNDGDLDLLLSSYDTSPAIYYAKNDGTPEAPNYQTPQINPFGIQPNPSLTTSSLVDIDNDGDLDLMTGTYNNDNGDFSFQENTGTPDSPSFGPPVLNPFGLTATYGFSTPNWADLDGDGDMDLIAGEYYGSLQYFENTGSATAPAFAAPIDSPFGLPAIDEVISFIDFADLDGDGDLDVMVGGTYEYGNYGVSFHYAENTGTATDPGFDEPIEDPFGLEEQAGYILAPNFADIDDDGDYDLFAATAYGVLFFENLGAAPTSQDASVFTVTATPYPFSDTDFAFMDNDGDEFEFVKIFNTVSVGALTFNGSDVVDGQVIAVSELSSLVFTPVGNDQGQPYDSFVFQVGDSQNVFSDDHTMTINVGAGVAAKDRFLEATLQVFPNPTTDMVHLNLESETILGDVQIIVMDESARQLMQQTASAAGTSMQQSLNVQQMASGSYFIQILADGKTITRKFVKN